MKDKPSNDLYVGPASARLANVLGESIDLVWLDVRGRAELFGQPYSHERQLALFEIAPFETQRTRTVDDPAGRPPASFEAYCAEARRQLRKSGFIVTLCEPATNHKARETLDETFGAEHFVQEFVVPANRALNPFGESSRSHDILIAYRKSSHGHLRAVSADVPSARIKSVYRYVEPTTARRYALGDCVRASGRHDNSTYEWRGIVRAWRWSREEMGRLDSNDRLVYSKNGLPRVKRYVDEVPRPPIGSVWSDIERTDRERAIAERVIRLTTDDAGTILDLNCMAAEVLVAATGLRRSWIAVSPTYRDAITIRNDLYTAFGSAAHGTYCFHGLRNAQDVHALVSRSPAEFKAWALGTIGARPRKKAGHDDLAVDGRLWLHSSSSPIPVVVKTKHIGANDLRDLNKLIRRERSPAVVLITPKKERLSVVLSGTNIVSISSDQLLKTDRARLLLEIEQSFKTRRHRPASVRPHSKKRVG